MERELCFICCKPTPLFSFKYCTCKMSICEPCLTTWNTHTMPNLLCPVCRNCYGQVRPIFFSVLTHRILYYNQRHFIEQTTCLVVSTGLVIFVIGLYATLKIFTILS